MTPHGKLVIDCGVAIKWYVPEGGSAEASSLLERPDPLIAPDLLMAEFGNVVWKKVRRGELTRPEAVGIVDAFVASNFVQLWPATPFLRPAFDIATGWQCTVYDALYLAVALAEECPFVTADSSFARALRGTVLEPSILVLGEL